MKTKQITFFIIIVAAIGLPYAKSQNVTREEAGIIAQNWINIIVDQYDGWGDYDKAYPELIQQFERSGQLIGYYCQVNPEGYIVMSIRKELAPVKVYSETGRIDMTLNEGMPDLIKDQMEAIINEINQQAGPIETLSSDQIKNLLEVDYSESWQQIYSYKIGTLPLKLKSPNGKDNYQEGEVLLSSSWHQNPPYNDDCPDMGCGNSNGRAVVGCVATAGAQIMKYWNWPPYGVGSPYNDSYDWMNMKDNVTISSPQEQIDAVAELCWEVGDAVNMDYGCDGSGAFTSHMVGVFEDDFYYSSVCTKKNRDDFTANEWFERLKEQFNNNRPVQYRILEHSIVGDGWKETGSPVIRQYHMNYGWNNSYNAWYILDALHYPAGGNTDDEYMLENIVPIQSIGSGLLSFYPKPLYPYRYFDQDATGSNSIFMQGQNLQFLPNVTVSSDGNGNGIVFIGTPSDQTTFYTKGDMSKGIKLSDGKITLHNQGSIKLH